MKCKYFVFAMLLMTPLAHAQYAQRSLDVSMQLDAGGSREVLDLLKNDKLLKKQSQLVNLQKTHDFGVVKIADFDYVRTLVPFQPGLERVVTAPVTNNIKDKIAQDRIVGDFCKDANDPNCPLGITLFAKALVDQVVARSKACTDLQSKLSQLSGFNGGNADLIDNSDLDLVLSYHKECTTPDLPASMKNLIGLVVDTSTPCVGKEAGIIFPDGKRYVPIGMAVQISPNKIYTARHLLYKHIYNDKFVDKRQDNSLVFLPASGPIKPIKIIREIRPADMSDESARVPFDQAVLEISATPLKGTTGWPVVKRTEIIIGQAATPLLIAGFHLTLAKAYARQQHKDPFIALADWPNFLRRDAADSCRRVTQNASGCMLHACDTVGGLSGSPIFAQPAGVDAQPVVIGVHRGEAYSSDSLICSAGIDGQDLNIGALPSPLLLQN